MVEKGLTPVDRPAEFVRLWTLNARRVYAYIRTTVPNRSDADDLFQETSLVLWDKFDQFSPGTNFYAWACRVAYLNVCNQRRRKEPGTLAFDDALLELLHGDQLAAGDAVEQELNALADCYAKLRPVDQDLLRRRYVEGATIQRVAIEVGRPVEGLYKAMRRIHETLFICIQRRLEEEEGS
jgi:RNA polymerase sigma-70 factor (ECF subfamily)